MRCQRKHTHTHCALSLTSWTKLKNVQNNQSSKFERFRRGSSFQECVLLCRQHFYQSLVFEKRTKKKEMFLFSLGPDAGSPPRGLEEECSPRHCRGKVEGVVEFILRISASTAAAVLTWLSLVPLSAASATVGRHVLRSRFWKGFPHLVHRCRLRRSSPSGGSLQLSAFVLPFVASVVVFDVVSWAWLATRRSRSFVGGRHAFSRPRFLLGTQDCISYKCSALECAGPVETREHRMAREGLSATTCLVFGTTTYLLLRQQYGIPFTSRGAHVIVICSSALSGVFVGEIVSWQLLGHLRSSSTLRHRAAHPWILLGALGFPMCVPMCHTPHDGAAKASAIVVPLLVSAICYLEFVLKRENSSLLWKLVQSIVADWWHSHGLPSRRVSPYA